MLERLGLRSPDRGQDMELLEQDLRRTVGWLQYVVFAGIVALFVWAIFGLGLHATALALLGAYTLVGAAAALAGAVVGFLFGVPRITRAEGPVEGPARLAINTNLVDVSDWLTKLLLGATLTQLGNLPEFVWGAAGAIAWPEAPGGRVVAAAVLVYYSAAGFLGFYLITQIYLTLAFKRASDFLTRPEAGARVKAAAERAALFEAALDRPEFAPNVLSQLETLPAEDQLRQAPEGARLEVEAALRAWQVEADPDRRAALLAQARDAMTRLRAHGDAGVPEITRLRERLGDLVRMPEVAAVLGDRPTPEPD